MWIERLELENFRGFEQLALTFRPGANLLLGTNGAGKSSVLDALAMVVGGAWELRDDAARACGVRELAPSDLRLGAERVAVRCALRSTARGFATLEAQGQPEHGAWSTTRSPRGAFAASGSFPAIELLVYFGPYRTQRDRPSGLGLPVELARGEVLLPPFTALANAFSGTMQGYEAFARWFGEAEAIENADRLGAKGTSWRDPQLEAVRGALRTLLEGTGPLRFDRRRHALMLEKRGHELDVGMLSDGERALVALAGELGWRLAVGCGDARSAEAVVLLDEVELHLHPAAQRVALPRLQDAFPNVQFIATTHSPQVVASVPSECVQVLRDFRVVAPAGGTYGRDSNSLLVDVFGTDDRPRQTRVELDAIARDIDEERFDLARERLEKLATLVGTQDREVSRLQSLVSYLDAEA